ncbi:lysylphosphatidylglycerol synthase transmembrane domain-containing protein [Cyclobacterium xiamenense]|uniref:lysylphosphatidylglycerol synthase transmembrane domain-containing protein n=1 Tax=Cyclobacterium xiamenense TaxID=1297121 RepID=UPI0012B87DD4|nr:lysylphosphatidylglycerol synthase transmembrane domain-containing protein [Cyclobacterium xiamenense]
MSKSLKRGFQVGLSLLVAVGILYFLYKDIEKDAIVTALKDTGLFWLTASVSIGIVGYLLRAWRWKLLIATNENFSITTAPVFWALMVGYLINLLIPRAGELARCGAVNRVYPVPTAKLLGTVVLERTIDMAFMLLLVTLALVSQGAIFSEIFEMLVSLPALNQFVQRYFILGLVLATGLVFLLYVAYRNLKNRQWMGKIRQISRQFVSGLETVVQMKNQSAFWAVSLLIWIIYFFMMYWIARAMPATSSLSAGSVLMVLVMGSIGMVAPVQGGIGTFHALVAFILLFYGIAEEQGKIFAMVVHASQMLTILVLGGIGLLYFLIMKKSNLQQKENVN